MQPTELISSKKVDLQYLLVCKDGCRAIAQTVELARRRVERMTSSPVMMSFLVHPETTITSNGYIKYPDGYPPTEFTIKKGKEWTAKN